MTAPVPRQYRVREEPFTLAQYLGTLRKNASRRSDGRSDSIRVVDPSRDLLLECLALRQYDGECQPALGRTADSWRIVETRDRGLSGDRREIHGTPTPAAIPDLAHVLAESHR